MEQMETQDGQSLISKGTTQIKLFKPFLCDFVGVVKALVR